ncbi:MAG: hypothetical protein AB1Y26_07485 [Cycloclasticus sp.]
MEPRNYEDGAAGTPPLVPSTPSTGYPTEGNPQSAIPATKPGAHWFYKIGESLRNVITTAGLTPDDGDLNLVQKAIVKIVGQSNHVVRLDGATFAPAVADGNAVYWDEGNSRYDKAIADATDKQDVVGFADVTNSLVEAFGRSDLFSGLTAGSRYYLSDATAGAITTVAPAEKVMLGLAKSATTLFVDIDPDSSVVAASETEAGVVERSSQAETDNLTDDIRYVSPLKMGFGFSSLLATNGYIVFPSWLGGLIIQWGKEMASASVTKTVTFPIAFPTEIFIATATDGSASGSLYVVGIDILDSVSNKSSMLIRGSSTGLGTFYWTAIGK